MLSTRLFRSSVVPIVLALAAGCGGADHPGSDGGTDGGAGDGGGGSACSADPHGPACAFRLTSGAYHVYGVTSDSHAVIVDGSANASLLDLATGTMTPFTSNFTNVIISSGVAFAFHGGTNASQQLPVTLWSATSGVRELDPSMPMYRLPPSDGTHLAWVGNVSADGSSGDVRLGSVDGKTAPLTLQAGVAMGGSCGSSPQLSIVGTRLLVMTCPPNGSTHTLSSYDLDSGALVGSIAQLSNLFDVDRIHQRVLFSTASGGAIADLDLGTVTTLATDYFSGGFTPDGNSVLYVDSESKLMHVAAGGGTPAVVQPGPVQFVQAISPDSSTVLYSTNSDDTTTYADLYMTQLVDNAPAPLMLRQQLDVEILSTPFTPDSKFALYASNVDAAVNGTFWAQPVSGGVGRNLANLDFYWITVGGSRVVYTDALVESVNPVGYADGTGNIELVDLAGNAAPTTLVKGANANMSTTPDQKSLVYSIIDDAAHAGVYVMLLP